MVFLNKLKIKLKRKILALYAFMIHWLRKSTHRQKHLKPGRSLGLGAEPWLRTVRRAGICSPCWSQFWVWLVSCCLFFLFNLFLSEAEGIKDAIWDCLFRYSMVLTSFPLSLPLSCLLLVARSSRSTCPNEAIARDLFFIMNQGQRERGRQEMGV